ncbi:hypothetical protein VNO78_35649 [Psophocarpus tetragonolobus]|uniref:Uncharacterized protein n=1 Tax=Psophocarpus tetragonolobus TaxID=3891 RepID=A0AAN9NLG2_PSOTE
MDGAKARDIPGRRGKGQAPMSRRARRSLQNPGREPGRSGRRCRSWCLPTLETAQPEVGSSGWKSTARRVVSGAPPAALENLEDRVPPTPGRKGSRQNGSVTSGKGLALRAGHGGPSPEPVGCRWTARAAPAARAGRRVPVGGRIGNGPFGVSSPGVEQSTQNCQGNGLGGISGERRPC